MIRIRIRIRIVIFQNQIQTYKRLIRNIKKHNFDIKNYKGQNTINLWVKNMFEDSRMRSKVHNTDLSRIFSYIE